MLYSVQHYSCQRIDSGVDSSSVLLLHGWAIVLFALMGSKWAPVGIDKLRTLPSCDFGPLSVLDYTNCRESCFTGSIDFRHCLANIVKQLCSCLILRGVTFRAQHLSLTSDADKIFKKFKYSQIYTGNDHEMQMAGQELDLFNLRRGRFAPTDRA